MSDLTELEWNILDNLSNDWECKVTICPEVEKAVPGLSRIQILQTLCKLHEQGLLTLMNGGTINLNELVAEPEDDFGTRYWFGLTALGCSEWEANSERFSGEPIDWSRSWIGRPSNVRSNGYYIDGTSREVCLQALDFLIRGANWGIDKSSLEHLAISGFQAKYYKYIEGGHRVTFRLRKKKAPK